MSLRTPEDVDRRYRKAHLDAMNSNVFVNANGASAWIVIIDELDSLFRKQFPNAGRMTAIEWAVAVVRRLAKNQKGKRK